MKVLLLAGGESSERAVSLKTGKAIYEALMRLGHKVLAVDPCTGQNLLEDGIFMIGDKNRSADINSLIKSGKYTLTEQNLANDYNDVEVVFNGLHGGYGENGRMQCLLDLAGKKYTGSGMAASTIAMDKSITKHLAASEHINTPRWALCKVEKGKIEKDLIENITAYFKPPFIVKPNDGGSTVGLTKVVGYNQLEDAMKTALKESPNILVEEFIAGREMTAAILNGDPLPVVEIKPLSGLYDYEAKYTSGKSEYFVPADVPTDVSESIQSNARTIYNLIGASGLARVDFILDDDNKHHFLEINTLPGMTSLSLAPMAAKAVGIDFDKLIKKLLEAALEK
ncbi:MAG: D-alanine--D-alanine ligase [bacterium]